MPILTGTTRPEPEPRLYQPGVEVGRARATYIDPTGGLWPLDVPSLGWFTLDEVTGLGATEADMVTDPHPWGGTTVRHFFIQPRVINWPLAIFAQTHQDFQALYRGVARAFLLSRRLGPGRLQIAQPDGTVREILVRYQTGFVTNPGRGLHSDIAILALYCSDAYWRDPEPTPVVREFSSGTSYLDPYPTVSSSRVLGDTTITNPGEVQAWPEWTITGPGESITATNNTTGQSFTLDPDWDGDGPLGDGDTITISTFPPQVRGPSGQIWTGALNWPGAQLWPLEPGANDVTFSVTGANTGTRIELAYRARYETT